MGEGNEQLNERPVSFFPAYFSRFMGRAVECSQASLCALHSGMLLIGNWTILKHNAIMGCFLFFQEHKSVLLIFFFSFLSFFPSIKTE